MKRICIIIALLTFHLSTLSLSASVPLRWTVETSRLQPAVFDVVRGETLALEASFQSYGKPLSTSNMTAFLCWQTNGMSSAWWVTNAVTTATVARVLFTPEMDPGAQTVTAFLGLSDATNVTSSLFPVPSSLSYRAAVTLRFRHGPGQTPNALPIPPKTIDWARVENANVDSAPFVVKGGEGGVTLSQVTNAVSSIITNNVDSGYLCTVETAAEMTNNVISFVRSGGRRRIDTSDRGPFEFYTDDSSDDIYFNRIYINITDGFDQIRYNGLGLDTYLRTLGWHPQSATLSQYGITDGATVYNSLGGSVTYWYFNDETSRNELGVAMKDDMTWIEPSKIALQDYDNTWSVEQSFIHGAKVFYYFLTETNDETVANYKLVKDTVEGATNGLITAQNATNAAEAVFANNADYALTNLTGTSVSLASGQIGNVTLSNVQTNLALSLDFSATGDRSGDCLLYLVNTADTTLSIEPSETVTPVGINLSEAIKAGTNIVMATRMKREGNKSVVLISTKEVK